MKKQESTQVIISIEAQKVLLEDVYQRRNIEACGVLIGKIDEYGNWHVSHAHPLRNIFASPVYFEFAPEDLLAIELSHPGQIVGVYHSHPTGFATASNTDRKNMRRVNLEQQIPWVWLIISGPFDTNFLQQVQGRIENASISAYHHYKEGLRQISLCAEQTDRTSLSNHFPYPNQQD